MAFTHQTTPRPPPTTPDVVGLDPNNVPTHNISATQTKTTDNTCHNPHPRAPWVAKGTQHALQRHEGEGRGFVLRSPKEGLSAGTWRWKVVMCPGRGNDPASGHPRAHQPPLGRGTSPPAWDGRLDAPGQRRRHLPSAAWTRCREVKQGKSGGSVGTTDQGNGKGRSGVRPMGTAAYGGKGQGKGKGRGEGQLGQGGRGRSQGGEKPMGTTAYGGKGSKGWAANGDRPVGAASCRRDHHTMALCQTPPHCTYASFPSHVMMAIVLIMRRLSPVRHCDPSPSCYPPLLLPPPFPNFVPSIREVVASRVALHARVFFVL